MGFNSAFKGLRLYVSVLLQGLMGNYVELDPVANLRHLNYLIMTFSRCTFLRYLWCSAFDIFWHF